MSAIKSFLKNKSVWLVAAFVYALGQAQRFRSWEYLGTFSLRNLIMLVLHSFQPLFLYGLVFLTLSFLRRSAEKRVQHGAAFLSSSYLYFGLITAATFGMNFLPVPSKKLFANYLPFIHNSLPIIFALLVLFALGPTLFRGLRRLSLANETGLVIGGGIFVMLATYANYFIGWANQPWGQNWLVVVIYAAIFYDWLKRQAHPDRLLAYLTLGTGLFTAVLLLTGVNRFQLAYGSLDVVAQPLIMVLLAWLVLIMERGELTCDLRGLLRLSGLIIATNYLGLLQNIITFHWPISGKAGGFNLLGNLAGYAVVILLAGGLVQLIVEQVSQGWHARGWQSRRVNLAAGAFVAGLLNGLMTLSNYVGIDKSAFNLMYSAGERPLIILLNWVLMFGFFLILQMLINRPMVPLAVYTLIFGTFTLANFLKMIDRKEPILPIELVNLTNLPALMKMIDRKILVLAVVAIALFVVLVVFLIRYFKKQRLFKLPARIVSSVLVLGLSAATVYLPQEYGNFFSYHAQDSPAKTILDTLGYHNSPQRPLSYFLFNGEAFSFLGMSRIKVMDEPEGYSEKAIDQLLIKYQKQADQLNQQRKNELKDQTVIYVLSETFADPERMPTVEIDRDPIPKIQRLMAKNTSGVINSFGYGGGTADIEFEALTSLSMNNFASSLTVPYVYLVPKMTYIPSVLNDFDKKIAIHPYTPYIYSRTRAFADLGFDQFYNTESTTDRLTYRKKIQDSEYISDASAYAETLKHLKTAPESTFIQLSTMQNHMPYDTKYKNTYTTTSKLKKSANKALETFVQGLSFTDDATADFIKTISKMDRKVTVVFYGDHNPSVYDYQSSYQLPSSYKRTMYNSDYFIYSNFTRKQVSPSAVVSPVNFTPMVLAQTKSKVSPYNAMLTQVWQELPAGERGKFMTTKKELTWAELSKQEKALLHDYQLIQYDITAGKQYTLKHNKRFYQVAK